MSAERCPTCLGKGSFKRMGAANPPYYADDCMEVVECPDCVEEAVEIVEAALADGVGVGRKLCPRCRIQIAPAPFFVVCTWFRTPPSGHRSLYGKWLCACGLGFCDACYNQLED